jgi:exopolysaccharide biosynthesis polyprenyl glycosylphosphotransferase
MRDLAMAVLAGVAPLAPVVLFYEPSLRGLALVLLFGTFTFFALGAERGVVRMVAGRIRRGGRNLRNVVVIGTGDGMLDLTSKLARREEYGFRIVGVLDAYQMNGGGLPDPAQVVGSLQAIIEQEPVDEVFIVLPLDLVQPIVRGLVTACEEQGITVRLIAQVADPQIGHATVDEIEGQPVWTLTTGRSDPLGLAAKRAIDIVAASVGLTLLLPLFLIVAASIALDSRGPIFFTQPRFGYNRRRFPAYKFRTMVVNAEALQSSLESHNEATGPVFKIREDPRVTKLGKWLRQTSIDELPQLVNVLKGEMSLVGPRPLPVRDVERMDVRWHRRRFSVKPGITCLWQVNSRLPQFDEWARWDLEYIDNWSLGLDLKILAQTIPAVLSRHGAC